MATNRKFQVLKPSEINYGSVMWMLSLAMYDVSLWDDDDDDESMIICRDLSRTYLIRINTDKKILTFHYLLGVRADASEKRKLRFVNAMSKKFILVNAVLLDNESMLTEYQLLYDGGFSVGFLLSNFHCFVEISRNIMYESCRRGLAPEVREDEVNGSFKRGTGSWEDTPIDDEAMDVLMQRLFEGEETETS